MKPTACWTWDFSRRCAGSQGPAQRSPDPVLFGHAGSLGRHLVSDYTRNPVRLAFGSTLKPSENVRVQAFEVDSDRKQEMLHRLLSKETGRCLIFARTKRGTERLARNLNREGFAAAMIHGDRSQSQRTAALTGFQQGRYRILVATDLASRGIHVQDIAHVINYDLPEVAENFIHRVGRTGRAGEQGVASTSSAGNNVPTCCSWNARWASAWKESRLMTFRRQAGPHPGPHRSRRSPGPRQWFAFPGKPCKSRWEARHSATAHVGAGAPTRPAERSSAGPANLNELQPRLPVQ